MKFNKLYNLLFKKDHRKKITSTMGLSQEVADKLHSIDEKFSIWIADQIKDNPEFQKAKDKVDWIDNFVVEPFDKIKEMLKRKKVSLTDLTWNKAIKMVDEVLDQDLRYSKSKEFIYEIGKFEDDPSSFEKIERLLNDKKVDIGAIEYGLRVAVDNGYEKLVELILKDKRINPSNRNNFAIKMASHGKPKIVELLLKDKRVDPSAGDNYSIKTALKMGKTKIVELLLKDDRIDPTLDDNYPFRQSVIYGYEKIVKLLLKDDRVDPSIRDNIAIIWLTKHGPKDSKYKNIANLLKQHPKVIQKAKELNQDLEKF